MHTDILDQVTINVWLTQDLFVLSATVGVHPKQCLLHRSHTMNRREFLAYKKAFADGARQILAQEGSSKVLNEAAFPSYANENPLISFLFWERIRRVMTYLNGLRFEAAMDFGCGGGVMLPFLSQIARRVVAVDINLSPLKKMASHIAFPSRIEIYDASQKKLEDFAQSSFDLILALDVLEHVDDLTATLSDFCTILKPGGTIIVSGPTENMLYRLGRRIAGPEYSGEYHERSIDEIRDALAMFTKVSTVAILFYPIPLFKILCGTVPSLRTTDSY